MHRPGEVEWNRVVEETLTPVRSLLVARVDLLLILGRSHCDGRTHTRINLDVIWF